MQTLMASGRGFPLPRWLQVLTHFSWSPSLSLLPPFISAPCFWITVCELFQRWARTGCTELLPQMMTWDEIQDVMAPISVWVYMAFMAGAMKTWKNLAWEESFGAFFGNLFNPRQRSSIKLSTVTTPQTMIVALLLQSQLPYVTGTNYNQD